MRISADAALLTGPSIRAEKIDDARLSNSLDAFFSKRHSILASFALHVSLEFDVAQADIHYDPRRIRFQGAYKESQPRGGLAGPHTCIGL